jgi:hypothetical protein
LAHEKSRTINTATLGERKVVTDFVLFNQALCQVRNNTRQDNNRAKPIVSSCDRKELSRWLSESHEL